MAQFEINWLTVKKPDWYELSLIDSQGSKLLNVSVNELDKKTGQQAWPDWKNIKAGQKIEGNLWTSPKGKTYLFPSQEDENAGGVVVRTTNGQNYSPRGSQKAAGAMQYQKAVSQSVEVAQDNKNESVKTSATFRDATLLTVCELGEGADTETIRETWLRHRAWLLANWDLPAF